MAGEGGVDWFELMTTDPEGAQAFYRSVLGWEAQPAPGGIPYTLLTAGGVPAAGSMKLPADAGGVPFWHGYVTVADLDTALARAGSLGARLVRPAMDIAGIGRLAPIADPQGAILSLLQWQFAKGDPVPPLTPGHVGWLELRTTDWRAALAFYTGLFGWEAGDTLDLGPEGSYQIVRHEGRMMAGLMNQAEGLPGPAWSFYWTVGDIDAGAARVTDAGGAVLHGPAPVPGGMWIALCRDPQGAAFNLVGARVA